MLKLGCYEIFHSWGPGLHSGLVWLGQALRDNKDTVATAESVAKIFALVVGGWWTWKAFVRKRLKFPSAKIEHVITHWRDTQKIFLRAVLRITNTGSVLIPIAAASTRVEQLTPLPDTVRDSVVAGRDPDLVYNTEIAWEIIQERQLDTSKDKFEIEPGEADDFAFDFVLDETISRVLIYSHIENPKKRGWFGVKEMGWNVSTVYDIQSPNEKCDGRS